MSLTVRVEYFLTRTCNKKQSPNYSHSRGPVCQLTVTKTDLYSVAFAKLLNSH